MRISSTTELGALARTRRERLRWTQADLAERVGTTRQWISRFEKGAADATLERVLMVLAVLELTVDVLRPGESSGGDPYARIREQLRTLKLPAIDSEQSRRIAVSIASSSALKATIERMSRLTFNVPTLSVPTSESASTKSLGSSDDHD